MIEVKKVGMDSGLVSMFHRLPYDIYAKDPMWVPSDPTIEAELYEKKHNPALEFSFAERWVAIRDGKCVGRVSAIVNRRWIEKTGDPVGRLCRYDSIDDQEVARALLSAAEDWLVARGMEQAVGPLGFSNLDPCGITIEGFDKPATLGSTHTRDYYEKLWLGSGYEPMQDWDEYSIMLGDDVPESIVQAADKCEQRTTIRISDLQNRIEMRQVGRELFDLFDLTYSPLFGSYPLGDKMHKYYVEQYMTYLDPRYIYIARESEGHGHRMVGFIVAMPSIVKALQKCKWKLFPTGWWTLMRAMHHPKIVEILLAAVHPEVRQLGVLPMMIRRLLSRCVQDGVHEVQTTAILDGNSKAISSVMHFDAKPRRRKRCYVKIL